MLHLERWDSQPCFTMSGRCAGFLNYFITVLSCCLTVRLSFVFKNIQSLVVGRINLFPSVYGIDSAFLLLVCFIFALLFSYITSKVSPTSSSFIPHHNLSYPLYPVLLVSLWERGWGVEKRKGKERKKELAFPGCQQNMPQKVTIRLSHKHFC